MDAETAAQDVDVKPKIVSMLNSANQADFPNSHLPNCNLSYGVFSRRLTLPFSKLQTPAKTEPLRIELPPDAKPVPVKLRNYSAFQHAFTVNLAAQLLEYGLIYSSPSSTWASAPLLLLKRGPDDWRFTVDLHPVNKLTKRHQFPMPIIERELAKTRGSRFYANLGFLHIYWKMLVVEASKK